MSDRAKCTCMLEAFESKIPSVLISDTTSTVTTTIAATIAGVVAITTPIGYT